MDAIHFIAINCLVKPLWLRKNKKKSQNTHLFDVTLSACNLLSITLANMELFEFLEQSDHWSGCVFPLDHFVRLVVNKP